MRQSIKASDGDWADAREVVAAYFAMFPRAPGAGFGVFFKPDELLVASEVEDPIADGYQLAILELPSHMDRIGLVQWVRERIRQVAYQRVAE